MLQFGGGALPEVEQQHYSANRLSFQYIFYGLLFYTRKYILSSWRYKKHYTVTTFYSLSSKMKFFGMGKENKKKFNGKIHSRRHASFCYSIFIIKNH
jgi:hypothetical protein